MHVGPQKYYIIYEFVSDEITVTYPVGGEGLIPYRAEFIQWDAYGSHGNFDVEYSIDSGVSWTTIGNQVNGSLRLKQWPIPNSISGEVLVRVSRDSISGQSSDILSIIDFPKNININHVCECELTISWNPVPSAKEYEISVLGEKYMDSIGTTTETYYHIPIDNINQEAWFSVRAITESGTKGVRALAEYYDGSGISNCSLIPDFYTNKNQICTDYPVHLYDQTQGCPVIWNWSFQPNTVTFLENTNSSSQNPIISFDDVGSYQVNLSTQNNNSTSSIQRNDFYNVITENVLSNDQENNIIENFNNLNFPPVNWEILNEGQTFSWKDTSYINSNGLLNRVAFSKNISPNNFDKLITYPIFLDQNLSNPYLFFDICYSLKNGFDEDALLVEVSQDCGKSFLDTIYFKFGKLMSTTNSNQITSDNFRTEKVSLKNYIGKRIKLSFLSKSMGGNNLYLDNINISNLDSIEYNPLELDIYPNPSSGTFNLYFENFNLENIDLNIVDISGKLILNRIYSFSKDNPKTISLNLSNLSQGMYLLTIESDGKSVIKRLVISE